MDTCSGIFKIEAAMWTPFTFLFNCNPGNSGFKWVGLLYRPGCKAPGRWGAYDPAGTVLE